MLLLTEHRCRTNRDIQSILRTHTVGVSIGNFDGMHLGHQALFAELDSALSSVENPFKVLLTLIPHPRRKLSGLPGSVLRGDPSYWMITPARQKLLLAERFGFDAVYFLRFTKTVQSLTPTDFFRQIVVEQLHASIVVVGDDWRFGKGRSGTVTELAALAAQDTVETRIVPEVRLGSVNVRSSAVRQALLEGNLDTIETLLGRSFSVIGRVVHGDKIGRGLGFPTANIHTYNQIMPPDGVYAGYASIDGVRYRAAISLGTRPTVSSSSARILEVFLLDFPKEELYGVWMEVSFIKALRAQQKFESLEALRKQIQRDVKEIDAILSGH